MAQKIGAKNDDDQTPRTPQRTRIFSLRQWFLVSKHPKTWLSFIQSILLSMSLCPICDPLEFFLGTMVAIFFFLFLLKNRKVLSHIYYTYLFIFWLSNSLQLRKSKLCSSQRDIFLVLERAGL